MRPTLWFLAGFWLSLIAGFDAAAAELHDAAKRGDLAAVERLLAGGAQVDATDRVGATALYVAAGEGHAAVVARLLAAGGNARHQVLGIYGTSIGAPIHAAVRFGHLDVIRVLLEAGVDPNLPDDGAGPPLHVARRSGQAAAEALLRSFGARSIGAEPVDHLIASADPSAGEKIAGACAVCHALTKHLERPHSVGPTLWNIVGRPKAGTRGYEYSEALRKVRGRWTYRDLNSYIADPRRFAPGTKMEFRGISEPERRSALIAYLRTLSDQPQPLP